MNPKERYYSGVARETIHRITANRENWTSFLATMARNYDFTYPEQVMIYAQRPNATLCKPYEEWNTDQYRRYVKRGSTGIALFVMNQDKPYADIMASTYGLPEMARMLGVHRQTIYYIVANEDFELIKVGRYKRATKESFEKWYHNQTRYQLAEDRQERS